MAHNMGAVESLAKSFTLQDPRFTINDARAISGLLVEAIESWIDLNHAKESFYKSDRSD